MSLSADIQQAVRTGRPLDTLEIPPEKMDTAIKYAQAQLDMLEQQSGVTESTQAYRTRLLSTQPSLESPTMQGAEARRDVTREEESLLDLQHLMQDMPPGASIRTAPEMGFSSGRIIAKYENDRDVAKFLKDVVPKGAKPVKLTTRKGEPVWGYVRKGEPDFYRLTPNKLLEDPASMLGSLTAHPIELGIGMVGAFLPGGAVRKMAAEGAAAFAGRAVDEYMEKRSGASDDVPEIIGEAATSGATAAVTSGAFSMFEKAKNARQLSGASKELQDITETAERIAKQAGDDIDAFRPTIADASDAGPIWKRNVAIFNSLFGEGEKNRTKATMGIRLALYKEMQEAAAKGELPVRANGTIDWDSVVHQTDDEQVLGLINKMRDDLVDITRKKLSAKGLQAGDETLERAMQYETAVKQYSDASKASVDKAYSDLWELASDVNTVGVDGPERPVEFLLPKLKGVLESVEDIEVVDKDGVLRQWDISDLDPSLQSLLQKMKSLSDNQSKHAVEVTEFTPPPGTQTLGMRTKKAVVDRYRQAADVVEDLKSIRSQLSDLSNPDRATGSHTITSRVASRLYGSFSDAIRNPTGGTKEFQKAWKESWDQANKLHSDRMKVLDFFEAGKVLDDATGAAETSLNRLYANIASKQGAPVTLIDTLEKKFSKEQMDAVRSGYVDSLMNNPERLYKRQWSEAERRLIPKDVRELLQIHGVRMRRVNRNDLVKAMEATEEGAERIKRVILKTPPERLKGVLRSAGVSPDAYRATIFADILTNVTDDVKGQLVVNPQALKNAVRNLKSTQKSELFELLSPSQRALLNDSEKLASFVSKGDGIAVGLESMKIASKLTSPTTFASGAASASKYWLLGKAASNPAIVRLVTAGGKSTVHNKTRAMVLGSSLLRDDIMKSYSETKVPEERY